ncbi:MAG: hypothetical protein ACYDAR_16525 [Thermomicrobiales bacterium]
MQDEWNPAITLPDFNKALDDLDSAAKLTEDAIPGIQTLNEPLAKESGLFVQAIRSFVDAWRGCLIRNDATCTSQQIPLATMNAEYKKGYALIGNTPISKPAH